MFIDQDTGNVKCDLTEEKWAACRPVIVMGMQSAVIKFSEALAELADEIPEGYRGQFLRACAAFVDSAKRANALNEGVRCEPCEGRKTALVDEIIATLNQAAARLEAEVRAKRD